jgi:hypothetical protein
MNEMIARQLHEEALAGLAAAEMIARQLHEEALAGRTAAVRPDARQRLQSRLSWALRRMADRLDPVEATASRRTDWAG